MTRRQWLSVAGLVFSGLLPGWHARAQAPPPRSPDWIRTGHIGLGRRGRQLLGAAGEGALAVCDLDEARLRRGAAMAPPGIRGYQDYRDLLADRDVQAVVIATPTHWHAIQAIHALEAGKDVYIAAPVCLCFGEGEDLLRTARSFGAVCGTGHEDAAWSITAEQSSDSYYFRAPIHPTPAATIEAAAPPWWKAWLGPAGVHDYDPALEEGGHRHHPDFGLGQLGLTGAQFFYALLAAGLIPAQGRFSVEGSPLPLSQSGFLPPSLACRWQLGRQEIIWEQPSLGGDRCAVADSPSGASLWSASFAETLEHNALASWLQRVRDRNTTLTPLAMALRAALLAQAGLLAAQAGGTLQMPEGAMSASTDPLLRSRLWQPGYAAHRFGLEHEHEG